MSQHVARIVEIWGRVESSQHVFRLVALNNMLWDSSRKDVMRFDASQQDVMIFISTSCHDIMTSYEIRISSSRMTCCDDSEVRISSLVEMIMRFEYHDLQWLVAMILRSKYHDLLRWSWDSNIIICNDLLQWFNTSTGHWTCCDDSTRRISSYPITCCDDSTHHLNKMAWYSSHMIFISHHIHLNKISRDNPFIRYSSRMIFISYDIHLTKMSSHHLSTSHSTCSIISTRPTHRGDPTWNICISRSNDLIVRSFEWRGLRLHTWKLVWKVGDSRENAFDMYGDSRENLLEILTIVMIACPIFSVCGFDLLNDDNK